LQGLHGESPLSGEALDPIFGQKKGENSGGDGPELELARMDGGQDIPAGVMDIEIALGIRHNPHQDGPGLSQRSDIDSASSRSDPVDSQGLKELQPLPDFLERLLASADAEADRKKAAPV